MDKRHLHHVWTKIRYLKPWYFLAIALISGTVCVFALRANNQHMISLRSAVYAADKNDTDVQGALKRLQAYVTSHMNANLSAGPNAVYPPIQLKYTYDRLVTAQSNAAAGGNNDLYTAAQHYCEQQDSTDFSGRNRVPCIQQYVQSHTPSTSPANVPDALYKFAFISPKWSPDLAGWSLAVTIFSVILFIVSFAFQRWFKKYVS